MVLDSSDNILRAVGSLILSHPDVHLSPKLSTLPSGWREVFHMLWIKFLPAQKQETPHIAYVDGFAIAEK